MLTFIFLGVFGALLVAGLIFAFMAKDYKRKRQAGTAMKVPDVPHAGRATGGGDD